MWEIKKKVENLKIMSLQQLKNNRATRVKYEISLVILKTIFVHKQST
jgi:hypothetical protein